MSCTPPLYPYKHFRTPFLEAMECTEQERRTLLSASLLAQLCYNGCCYRPLTPGIEHDQLRRQQAIDDIFHFHAVNFHMAAFVCRNIQMQSGVNTQ